MLTPQQIVEFAEELLTNRFGGDQELSEVETLTGSGTATVLRARLAPSPYLDHRTVVIKYIPRSDDDMEDAAFLREVAAYQFTNSLGEEQRPGPVLLAHDVDNRVLILTDSGDGDTLDLLLRDTDPERRRDLLRDLGTGLGKMHAGTAGKEQDFDILLARVLKSHPQQAELHARRDATLGIAMTVGLDLLQSAGLQIPDRVRELAAEANKRLKSGRDRAFTPFDISPDNILMTDRTQFLDYEWADFRDVTFDIACVIAGFPQYVSIQPISDDEAQIFVDAWAGEVQDLWPNVRDDAYLHERIMVALIGWALSSISLLRYGSLGGISVELVDDAEPAAVDHTDVSNHLPNLLRPASEATFSHEEMLIRRDFFETFEALARFAAAGNTEDGVIVSDFAHSVAQRVASSPMKPTS